MKQQTALITAALLGAVAVGLGAFGAHAFKPALVEAGRLDTYELAVRYQFIHTLALLATALLMQKYTSAWLRYAAALFVTGIFFFSGSLYVLCLTNVTMWGAVTPLGGLAFILGWIALVPGVLKKSTH